MIDHEPKVTEVNGARFKEEIDRLNGLWPDDFMALEYRHTSGRDSFWWLVHDGLKLIGFAGMVPFEPFPRVGYLKRAAVLPAYHGRGLQQRLMNERTMRAKASTDWTHFVSECDASNVASANNFIRAGFKLVKPERAWAENTLFWRREI